MTSAEQQLILEFINRARSNPNGEFEELIPDGEGLTPEIELALSYFDVDLSVLADQLDAYDAVAPLAFNTYLATSATTHNDLMIEYEQQSHNLPGEPSLDERIVEGGYENALSYGESVYAYTYDPTHSFAGFYIDWGNSPTGIQEPAGHRDAILNESFTEVGIAWAAQTDSSSSLGPYVTTHHYGNQLDYQEQVLGVVFDDADGDDFYDIGEGLGGVDIIIFGENGTFVTASWESGGYQLVVPDGVYTVIFDGTGLGGVLSAAFTMDGENLKIDAVSSSAAQVGVTLQGFEGSDEMIGTSFGDTLYGGSGGDYMSANDGDDVISGDDGKDKIYGNKGNDELSGDSGKDKIFGGNGGDTVSGGKNGDKLYGNAGSDDLSGGSGKDKMYGGSGDDILSGGSGKDKLFGGSGDDELFGNGSGDKIEGGSGDDVLTGGSGSDVFVFESGHDADVITDFEVGKDTLQIAADLAGGLNAQQIVDGAATTSDGSTVLSFGAGDQILLEGITDPADLIDSILVLA